MEELLDKVKKHWIVTIIGFLISIGWLGKTSYDLYRNVVFKEDLKEIKDNQISFKTEQNEKIELHEKEMEAKYRSLLCFACRVPTLATDSKCTESCTSKASFKYKNKSYEAIIVADPDDVFRVPAAIGPKSIHLDGKHIYISDKFKDNLSYSSYRTVILKSNGQPVKSENLLNTMEAAVKANIDFKIERFEKN